MHYRVDGQRDKFTCGSATRRRDGVRTGRIDTRTLGRERRGTVETETPLPDDAVADRRRRYVRSPVTR